MTTSGLREPARWIRQFSLTLRARRLEVELNRALFGQGSDTELEAEMSSLLRSDPETRWASQKIADETSILDTGEIHEIQDFNPRPAPVPAAGVVA